MPGRLFPIALQYKPVNGPQNLMMVRIYWVTQFGVSSSIGIMKLYYIFIVWYEIHNVMLYLYIAEISVHHLQLKCMGGHFYPVPSQNTTVLSHKE